MPVDQPRHEVPIGYRAVIGEVAADLVAAVSLRTGDEIEPHLIGEHVAYGIEIARVETVDIGGEKRALGFRQYRERMIVGLLRQRAQARAAPGQRRLDG